MKNKSFYIQIFVIIIFLILGYLLTIPIPLGMPSSISFSPEQAKKNGVLIQEYKIDKKKEKTSYEIGNIWMEYKVMYEGFTNKLLEVDKNNKNFIVEIKYPQDKKEEFYMDSPIICFESKSSRGYTGLGKYIKLVYIDDFKSPKNTYFEIKLADKECQNIKTTLFLSPKK